MGIRSRSLSKILLGQNTESDVKLILLSLLEVQEEILEELRAQSAVEDEEQGHASLSDR
jgi:hypothetical protein